MAATTRLTTDPATSPPLPRVPTHVAVIMDGNGRWAQSRRQTRHAGHRAGANNIRPLIEACGEVGVKIVTLFAFSTENWGRPTEEVRGLLQILGEVLTRETRSLHAQGVQLRHLGTLEGIPERTKRRIRDALELTRCNDRLLLNVAFNYGGRAEIIEAARRLIRAGVPADSVDEATFAGYLYTAGLPDPDLIIRTAGEMRLSNFLLWQAAYAEYYSTPVYWPDFDRRELYRAFAAYAARNRRFGRASGSDDGPAAAPGVDPPNGRA